MRILGESSGGHRHPGQGCPVGKDDGFETSLELRLQEQLGWGLWGEEARKLGIEKERLLGRKVEGMHGWRPEISPLFLSLPIVGTLPVPG